MKKKPNKKKRTSKSKPTEGYASYVFSLPRDDPMRGLHCLGAYRLVTKYFPGDWKAAQDFTKKVKGRPMFVGIAEWSAAVMETEENIAIARAILT